MFLRAAGLAAATTGLGGILEARRGPAWAQGSRLKLLHAVDFVPAGDEELTRQVAEAAKTFGAQITIEQIDADELQPRIASAIESGSGPDIIEMVHNWSHVYQKNLTDVSELAEWKERDQRAYYELSEKASKVDDRWLSLPYRVIGNAIVYRKDRFDELEEKAPKHWEENRRIAKRLKGQGYPFGQTLKPGARNASAFAYAYLWSWGGKEVEADGKTVAIDSMETLESVKFLVAMWKEGYEEGGLAWEDVDASRAYLSGRIATCLSPASIYLTAKRHSQDYLNHRGQPTWTVSDHFPLPAGPAGGFSYHVPSAHAVMRYSKNQKLARDFLKWLHSKEQFGKWLATEAGYSVGANTFWEQHTMWEWVDAPLKLYRTASGSARALGYAGPFSTRATEAYARHIITELYAKAIQGLTAEDAVSWADRELRKIYG